MRKGSTDAVALQMKVVQFLVDSEVYRDIVYVSKEDYNQLAKEMKIPSDSTLVAVTSAVSALTKVEPKRFAWQVFPDSRVETGSISMTRHQRTSLNLGAAKESVIDVSFQPSEKVQALPIRGLTIQLTYLPTTKMEADRAIYVREDKLTETFLTALDSHFINEGQYIPMMYDNATLVAFVKELNLQQTRPSTESSTKKTNWESRSKDRRTKGNEDPRALLFQTPKFDAPHLGQIQRSPSPQLRFVLRENEKRLRLGGPSRKGGAQISDVPLNFKGMGVGGLDEELGEIVRTAFLTRRMTIESLECYGVQHSKGILLYGPPGTGKTLIARTIANMFQNKKVKTVNGPEIFSSLVGDSEARVRELFEDAEAEYALKGDESDLHIIIFDEIDSICRKRGTRSGDTGVGDSVVNQLLTKIDGVNSLNNILLIGMTNRIDLLDEALLRSGRMDVHIRIGLPDIEGRLTILKIHTKKLRKHKKLDEGVDLKAWADATVNFSGSDLKNLVLRAVQYALPRNFDTKDNKLTMKSVPLEELTNVTNEDFKAAYAKVSPAYGIARKKIEPYISPSNLLPFNEESKQMMDLVDMYVETLKNTEDCPTLSLLLTGPPGVGKTTLAMELAVRTGAPFISVIGSGELAGMMDKDRINFIDTEFDKASQSNFSVIVLDNVEGILSASPDGRSYSNSTLLKLQYALKTPPKTKLLVIATATDVDFLNYVRLLSTFRKHAEVTPLVKVSEVYSLVKHLGLVAGGSSATTTTQDCDVHNISAGEKERYNRLLLTEKTIGDVMLFLKVYRATSQGNNKNKKKQKAEEGKVQIDFDDFVRALELD